MATRPWARKRIQPFPLRRAPDGSAFQQCGKCGVTVAVALLEMHGYECNLWKKRKNTDDRFQECGKCGVLVDATIFSMHKCQSDVWNKPKNCGVHASDYQHQTNSGGSDDGLYCQSKQVEASKKQKIDVQKLPRSAFRFFMESFEKECETEDWFEIDREGFQKWKDMTREERQPFITQAEEVDKAYQKSIEEETKVARVELKAHSTSFGYHDSGEDSLPTGWRISIEFDSYESDEIKHQDFLVSFAYAFFQLLVFLLFIVSIGNCSRGHCVSRFPPMNVKITSELSASSDQVFRIAYASMDNFYGLVV